jgi:putative protease
MANWDTPKSTGEYVGEVIEVRGNTLRVRLEPGVVLHNGDGLTMGSEGFNVNGVEGNLVKINKPLSSFDSRLSTKLFRNLDTEFIKNLHSERRIPVDIVFSETEKGFSLRIGDKEQTFDYIKEPAKNEAKAIETIRTQLSKLGDTPYIAREVTLNTKPYFIPISVLNEWRRSTII